MHRTRGYVISLARRPERLSAFLAQPWTQTVFDIEPYVAVDGSTFEMDVSRVNAWNLVHLSHTKCRAVIACCLSHVNIWKRIAREYEEGKHELDTPVAIFEDDAVLLTPSVDDFHDAWKDLTIPSHVPFVWLCSPQLYPRQHQAYTGVNALVPYNVCTAEAYMLRPSFASHMVTAIEHDLGAVDAHMLMCLKRTGQSLGLEYPLFRQRDRADSDIQHH